MRRIRLGQFIRGRSLLFEQLSNLVQSASFRGVDATRDCRGTINSATRGVQQVPNRIDVPLPDHHQNRELVAHRAVELRVLAEEFFAGRHIAKTEAR